MEKIILNIAAIVIVGIFVKLYLKVSKILEIKKEEIIILKMIRDHEEGKPGKFIEKKGVFKWASDEDLINKENQKYYKPIEPKIK